MTGSEITPAPRWRTSAAGLLDATLLAAAVWALRGRVAKGGAALAALATGTQLAREQLASPGQLLLGVRTVDRRTGSRPQLWRTTLLLGAGAGLERLTHRLQPTPDAAAEQARGDFLAEMNAILQRHPQSSPERDAERQALFDRHAKTLPGAALVRGMGAALAAAAVNRGLRHRLAPTVEILVRRRGHSA